MKFLGKKINFLLFIILLQGILLCYFVSVYAQSPSMQEPPEIILNDQKIIFNKKPILNEHGWLFPLEEIAFKLQDKVTVDLINRTITIQRLRDKSVIELNLNNGVVTVNNRPFKTLFGYDQIILGTDAQMVPTSALVMLLGLNSIDKDNGVLVLKNIITAEAGAVGTILPKSRTSIKELLIDYFTVTNSFDWLKTSELFGRRTEINSGFHNDNYAITSDLVLKSGTGAPLVNFDTGNFSYYKNNSPFQVHVGDRPLSLIKSPLLGGITMRGIQIQTKGFRKDDKIVYGTGLLPSSGKVLGKGLSFVSYGRAAEVIEWHSSPKKDWQFSVGEAIYNDLINNQLVRTKQSGGLFALSATKTGKYLEGESNIAFGTVSKNPFDNSAKSGPGGDLLIRFKPKEWLGLFAKGAYYSPGFYSLSGNPYFNNRNETTVGANVNIPRSNFGISQSVGKFNLHAGKPDSYEITNVYASTTPLKNGPTFLVSYSENQSKVSQNKAIDNLIFPINKTNLASIDLDTLIERRTNSFFRASILKSWGTASLSASANHFIFSDQNPLKTPLLANKSTTDLWTYDINFNKPVNQILGFQNYFQINQFYKQLRLGANVGPVFNKKLNFQIQTGALLQANNKPKPVYGLNMNYKVNKKSLFSMNVDKSPFITNISGLWQYNFNSNRPAYLPEVGEEPAIGRITGKIIVLDEQQNRQAAGSNIILPGVTRERGVADVRVHLGNYIIKTDKTGYFEFSSVTPGVHRLKVEYSDIPSYLTSITPEAVDVKVEGGKESRFNFVLAYFGEVSGKIVLSGEPELKLEDETELQDIRVYLDGTDFETLTSFGGSFILGDVKPGKYKLKVDPDFLPEDLEATEKEIEIEVHAKGKVNNIELPLKFRDRQQEIREF
jgi:hypothetical protein